MDNKYYIPDIKDFHLGYKCEDFNAFIKGNYQYEEITLDENSDWEILMSDQQYVNVNIRTKCLDKEDIESLGFVKQSKNWWIGYDDYLLESISGEIGYYLKATLHVDKTDNSAKILLHRYYNCEDFWWKDRETALEEGDSKVIFEGYIKSINELKKVIKYLGI